KKEVEKEIYNLAKFPSENPNPVMRVNNKKFLYINESGKNLLNTTEGSKIPKQFKQIIKQVFKDNINQEFEIKIDNKYFLFDFKPIKQENYINIYGQDITKIKEYENELLLEKKFSDDLINTSIDTIFVFNPQTGKAIRWNKAFKDISGYTDEEISSMRAPDSYYNDEDLKRASEATKRVVKDGSTRVEMSLITKEDKSIPFEYSGTSIKDTSGNSLIMSIGRDITERKIIEQELKESEEKFRNISEQSIMGITIIQDGLVKYFNDKISEINGYTKEDVKKWGPNEFQIIFHPEDRKFVMEQARKKQIGDPDAIPHYQYRIRKKDGEIRWIDIFSKSINYGGRSADLAMTIDITDKIKTEQQLKESEEKFRSMTEQSLVGIAVLQDGLFKYANNTFSENNGYSLEEMKTWGPNDFEKTIHPDDKEFVMEQARKKQTGDTDVINQYEYRAITKNGEIRWINLFSKTINYEGHPADLVITIDITDKIKAEKYIRESEEKFSKAFNSNTLAMSISTFNEGRLIEVNDAFLEFAGTTREEAIGKTTIELNLWDQGLEQRERIRRALNKQGNLINIEAQFTSKKRELRYGLFSFNKIIINDSPFILTIINDVTPIKLAEKKLTESEKRYRLISEATRSVVWTADMNLNLTYLSPNTFNIFGVTPEEALLLPLISMVTPKSYKTIKTIFEEELNIEKEKDKDLNRSRTYEIEQIHKDRSIIPIELTFTFLRDENGRAKGILGVSQDISERKKAEIQLKNSEKTSREAYDMMIFYKDLFTHDMNNILHIIGSSVEIIGLQLGESEKSVFIENMTKMISSQVERGAKLISDVRTLTELDDADIPINRVNITKFLTHSIKFIKKSYSEKKLSIFAEDLDMKYYTIGNELLQDVFDNILRNGIKHNENSEIQLSIKISKQTVEGKNNIKIEFIDNGIGIPEDRKIDIFQPSNRERKGSKGMGIGLSLVKKILDIFKGKIWVEDKIEGDYTQGSKFIVLLPEAN
ncbi:MAG: PAS domain S-box protein, partial [Candidatus Odinarchaeota archaeon]